MVLLCATQCTPWLINCITFNYDYKILFLTNQLTETMKLLKMNLSLLLILGLITIKLNAQEKSEQLWYCWEETIKPAYLDDYLAISKELIEICKQEKFQFAFYTWSSKPFVYELWYPLKSLNDIPETDKAWEKLVEKYGKEKYAAFNNTKVRNRSYSMSIRNDLQYIPENPDFNRNDALFSLWKEYSLIPGKESEFEEAVKWMNGQRKLSRVGHFVFYGTGGIGYDSPVYTESIGALSQEDFLKRTAVLDVKLAPILKEYNTRINSLIREKKEYNWWLLRDLSYVPAAE